jgi:hypothetical protein
MDLIASIKFIENRLGGYNSKQSKNKLAPKPGRNQTAYHKNAQTEIERFSSDEETQLGRSIDTTA